MPGGGEVVSSPSSYGHVSFLERCLRWAMLAFEIRFWLAILRVRRFTRLKFVICRFRIEMSNARVWKTDYTSGQMI